MTLKEPGGTKVYFYVTKNSITNRGNIGFKNT